MESLTPKLGATVKRLREARQLSREALAERANVAVGQIKALERGKEAPPLGCLLRIAGALGTSMPTLFTLAEQEPQVQAMFARLRALPKPLRRRGLAEMSAMAIADTNAVPATAGSKRP